MHLAAGAGVLPSAVDAALSAQARSSLEKMLCHQLAAAHSAAMTLVSRVGGGELPIVEESRLANAAARMMQVFQEGLLTLQKLKQVGNRHGSSTCLRYRMAGRPSSREVKGEPNGG